MALKPGKAGTPANVRRKCISWIDRFVELTENTESARIFRKWCAISTIAAALEQRVWLHTSSPLYPNLYTFLVGKPGIGKSRAINVAAKFLRALPDFHIAPTSTTTASLVDKLAEGKRTMILLPDPAIEYNTLTVVATELSVFMPLYEAQYIGALVQFYDVEIYEESRRHSKTGDVKMERPQLNILTGTAPANLMKFVPELGWEQGFMSRVIMIYSDERQVTDIFVNTTSHLPEEMLHDLKQISSLHGEFKWTEGYAKAVHDWRTGGQTPSPSHPKLTHYCARRLGHVLKLSMVSAIDRGNLLRLEESDFARGLKWLLEAEEGMPSVFQAGQLGSDSQAMDEIVAYINGHDLMPETKIVNFARRLVPAHAVMRVIDVMEKSDIIRAVKTDSKTGTRLFKVIKGEHTI